MSNIFWPGLYIYLLSIQGLWFRHLKSYLCILGENQSPLSLILSLISNRTNSSMNRDKDSLKFTGKHLCQSFFCNKGAGPRPTTLFQKRLRYRCFPLNLAKFLRAPFFKEQLWWRFCKDKDKDYLWVCEDYFLVKRIW